MNKSKTIRVILDIVVFVSVIFGWWFVALPLAVFGAWRYPYYLELIVAGLVYDSLFGQINVSLISYLGTIVTAVAAILIILIKFSTRWR